MKVELPFRLDVPEIACDVRLDPDCQYLGELRVNYDYSQTIVLREWNEAVLLHEVIHRIIQSDPERRFYRLPPAGTDPQPYIEEHEQLVRRLTAGLYKMGWRWTAQPGDDSPPEATS